jgi:phthalate 4,5-cis-dihydrodiol dehydrogenase
MTMAPVVRVAIVGLGVAGASMAAAISKHPHLMLDSAADPNPALRERFARDYGVAVFDDARSLFDRRGADAVYIASPHQYHKEHAVSAARCGKPLCRA